MSANAFSPSDPAPHATAAAAWLAKRDRGLSALEQDAYLEWLRADPQHGAAITHLEKTWGALDALAEWRPAHSPQPNPDLLARPRFGAWLRRPVLVGTLMAAALAGGFLIYRGLMREPAPVMRVIPSPERLTLADGSVVELNHGGRIEAAFTPELRRVRLLHGEAHFTVAKNPLRPFVVEVDGIAVRAVGTAFDVLRSAGAVEVLVTEGKVHVERPAVAGNHPAATPSPTPLVAGERAVVDIASAAPPIVAAVSAGEIARALAWQGVRLEFEALPLGEVITEFNLRNRQQLVIGDAGTGRLRVGGSFRADNVDAFVRLLEASFGVVAERRADGSLVLRREN